MYGCVKPCKYVSFFWYVSISGPPGAGEMARPQLRGAHRAANIFTYIYTYINIHVYILYIHIYISC